MEKIQQLDENQYDGWECPQNRKIEFDITKVYLERYITSEQASVLVMGGGPGGYAVELARKGYQVTLFDLSERHLQQAKDKALETGVQLAALVQGDARDTSVFETEFDVVLLIGPLHHLLEEGDRNKAVQNAVQLLKPGGILFATFLSHYLFIQHYLNIPEQLAQAQQALHFLEDGRNKDGPAFAGTYLSGYEEAQKLMHEYPLKQLAFANVENILGMKEAELLALPPEQYQQWLQVGLALAEDKHLMGYGCHFLYVGKKKRWTFNV